MQAIDILLRHGRYTLIAGMLLVIMAIAPAAQATSLAPAIDSHSDQDASAEPPANPALSRDAMNFLEDNWYFDYVERDSQIEAENLATAESSSDAFDFDAMERYPGLYTDSPDAASPAGDASVYGGLSHDEMKFLDDNWHLGPGIFIEDEDVADAARGNPSLSRDDIQFLEDNWHLDAGALIQDDDLADNESESRVITREEFQFNEDNWYFDTGETFPQDEVNDSTSGPYSGNNADASAGRSHNALTYPWGDFLEHDY
jgi:hypothetical protein